MKNFTTVLSLKSLRLLTLLLVSTSLLTITSCKKTEEVPTTATSYLRIINASPTLGTVDVYINTQKANTGALPFGGAIKYIQPAVGKCDVKFTIANDLDALLTKSVTLTANLAYSYYLIDKGSNLDGLLVSDLMNATTMDKAYVKFINLSPDAPALSLNVVGGASLATNKTYKTNSEFVAVDVKTQSFEIKDGAGIVKTTLLNEPILGGRYYTIIARGYLNPGNNDQAFSGQAIINQ